MVAANQIYNISQNLTFVVLLTSCYTESSLSTLSSSYTVGSETCVSSYITLCSIKDGQRWCCGCTTTVFVGVGVGVDGCDLTIDIPLPGDTSNREVRGHSTDQGHRVASGYGVGWLLNSDGGHSCNKIIFSLPNYLDLNSTKETLFYSKLLCNITVYESQVLIKSIYLHDRKK